MQLSCCSRRAALRVAARWLSVPAVAILAMAAEQAAAKASKADVSYRETPRNGKSCSSCRLFTPSESGQGSCAVVEGPIDPNGWCMAYSPRG